MSPSIATAPLRRRTTFAGRRVIVEGTPAAEQGAVLMRNPLYAFAEEA
jgi:hypothetical protein